MWWDEFQAARHPEWLLLDRERRSTLPSVGAPPVLTQMCLSHPGLLDLAMDHTTEILQHCDVDGLWFDMVNPAPTSVVECFCHRCLAEIEAAGQDPLDRTVQQQRQHRLFIDTMRRLTEHVRTLRPELDVEYNTMAALGANERMPHTDSIEIESIPSGTWGYSYLPVHGRYARTLGTSVYGITGIFQTHWGDYGGLKHPDQLRFELASTVALGLRCDVGDDPGPALRLHPAVYATIGEVYAEIERIEPYLAGAVPVAEAAIVVDGPPMSQFAAELSADTWGETVSELVQKIPEAYIESGSLGAAVTGTARLLVEHQVQFDIVEPAVEFERYRLLVLPDTLEVDLGLAERLQRYLDSGGAVIAAAQAAKLAATDRLWPQALDGHSAGEVEHGYPYTRITGAVSESAPRYAGYDFALYDGAERWELNGPDVVVHARLTEPAADPVHLAGYAVPPSGTPTEFATVADAGGAAVLAFPIGISYHQHGYWIYRELFGHVLNRLLPQRLTRTTAPRSAEVTLTQQAPTDDHGERWIVHVVNYSPLRGQRGTTERLEDPIPLREVQVHLDVETPIREAIEVRSGRTLPVSRRDGGWQVTVPEVRVAATIAFNT